MINLSWAAKLNRNLGNMRSSHKSHKSENTCLWLKGLFLKGFIEKYMFDRIHFTIFFYLTIISLTGISCHKKGDENVNSDHKTSDYLLKENLPGSTEFEDHDNILENISSKGTTYSKEVADLLETPMLPRGSAIMTSSGQLAYSGITAIIHAATGSMTKSGGEFEPTLESVNTSIAIPLACPKKGVPKSSYTFHRWK